MIYMQIIRHIYDDDYGCEERAEGEPLYVIAEIADENGAVKEFRIKESFLIANKLTVGSEWDGEIEKAAADEENNYGF